MDYSQYGALALAYMGDCVYEIKVREHLMKQANMPVNMLHRKAKGYVSAAAQSAFADKILPLLTEDEKNIFKRGRNAKPHTTPKNMTLSDYKKAISSSRKNRRSTTSTINCSTGSLCSAISSVMAAPNTCSTSVSSSTSKKAKV